MSAATIPIPTAEATPAATEPTPATSTTSTTPIPSVPVETTTSTTPVPAVIPAPANGASTNPLSGLSPTELKRKLEGSRKDLRTALDKKKRVDKELQGLEASIYAFEGSYLSDALLPPNSTSSAQFGNIIKGYDAYLKAPTAGSAQSMERKRVRGQEDAREGDRMFSRSSATYPRALEMRAPITIAQPEQVSANESEEETTTRKKRRNNHRE